MQAQFVLPFVDAPAARRASVPAASRRAARPAPSTAAVTSGNAPRLGELLIALSQALDLGEGRSSGHALRCCWIGQQIGRALGLNAQEMRELYVTTLIKDAGGSAVATRVSRFFASDDLVFKRDSLRTGGGLQSRLRFAVMNVGALRTPLARLRVCADVLRQGPAVLEELADLRGRAGAQVARQLGFSEDVADSVQALDERWDGQGRPQGMAAADIPLYARIAALAQVIDVFHEQTSPQATREEVSRRRGRQLDPRLVDTFAVLSRDPQFWATLTADDLPHRVGSLEPAHPLQPVDDDTLDEIAAVYGRIADAKSAFTDGHSARVASLCDRVSHRLGVEAGPQRWLRRGALLHDIGRLGVSSAILDKPGPLDVQERLQMQGHVRFTEQILAPIGSFGALARVVGAHREKLDGSGYPRGLDDRHIRLETRILSVADVYDALTSERPQRGAMSPRQALEVMRADVGGAFAANCLDALAQSVEVTDATAVRSESGAANIA